MQQLFSKSMLNVAQGVLGAAICWTLLGAPQAQAAGAYPSRPIRLEVPFAPGGAVDILARAIGAKVASELSESVIVENRPGAGGNIAAAYVARAKPDGYTVLIAANGLTANMTLFHHLSFDALKDLAPVAYVGYAPLILITGAGSPAKTLSDLLARARAPGAKMTFATAGYGSSGHLAAELFKLDAHINATHVPYKGGAPALIDLESNRVDFMFLDPLQVMPQMSTGRLRPIAVGSAQRLSLLPNVPTMSQAGMPGFDATVWWGFVVPAKTPAPIIAKLNTAINQALADPEVHRTLEGMGVVVQPDTPQQFGAFLKADADKWGKVVRRAKLSVD